MPPSAAVTSMTEAELQDNVIELAHLFRYRVAHFRPARTAHGWATPVSADGKGFPDLVLCGRGRTIFAECKSMKGKQSSEQKEWMIAIRGARSLYFLWTPEDWVSGRIEEALR